ncbi:M56 family metallopeptidase [Spirosoma validum]|uniref:M56 family metallopeptidase n=1 Tax=Spirosoma validum TaxID=2771355 RepID=A0A927B6L6_9BACT|nr:M56 family metallopeptidase [Spirosoma validum]MBD2756166.1 M56 family metallopeptidase [Spirosoma validum]
MITLPYLLTASLYLLLFYSCYVVLLRRNTFFGLNRAYLLVSVALSLLFPLVRLSSETVGQLPIGSITLPEFVVGSATERNEWSAMQWVWAVYGIGVIIMIVRLGLHVRAVFQLIRRGTKEKKSIYTLVRLPDDNSPSFSFGHYLVLNRTDAQTEPDALLRHEEAHIRQYHSVDVLVLEVVQLVFWFNPVMWFYKRALQELHEFLADRAVLKTPQPDYPRQLVAYALNVSPAALITPFVSQSTLKQRIVMLQKPASHRWALLSYVSILPLAACLVMCTQSERDQPQGEAERAHLATPNRAVKIEGKVYTAVEEQPKFPGGMAKLGQYLGENLRYPEVAQKAKAEGRVFVRFIVTKEGDITNVEILKGIGYGTEEEAKRVVSQMPRWEPAMQNGEAVNVQYHLPINFQLEDKKESAIPSSANQSAFFSFPTDDASSQKLYKHFVVNGSEVAFNEFQKYDKADIVEASSSDRLIRIQTH